MTGGSRGRFDMDAATRGDGLRILLVEDSELEADIIREALITCGFTVDVTGTAEAAMAQLEAAHYDIVLADLILPEGDGFELCARIRATPALSEVPVIVHTVDRSAENQRKGLAVGVDGFMVKGRDPSEMAFLINEVLRGATFLYN